MERPSPLRILIAASAVAVIAATVHAWVLQLGFFADDFREQQGIHRALAAERVSKTDAEDPPVVEVAAVEASRPTLLATWRPVLHLTSIAVYPLATTRRTTPPDPVWEHAVSLLINALVAALVVAVAARVGATAAGAFWAGVLFVMHPGALHGVAWVAARGDPSWVLFTLLAVLAQLALSRPRSEAPVGGARRFLRAARCVFLVGGVSVGCALAVLSKETGLLAFAVVMTLLGLQLVTRRIGWIVTIALLALHAGALVGYFRLRREVFGAEAFSYLQASRVPGLEDLERLVTVGLPRLWPQLIGGRLPDAAEVQDGWTFWVPTSVVALLAMALVLSAWRRWPRLLLVLGFGVASLLPAMYFLPAAEVAVPDDDGRYSRFLVAWVASFAIALGVAARGQSVARIVLPLIAALLGCHLLHVAREILDGDAAFRAALAPARQLLNDAGADADLVLVGPESVVQESVLAPWWAWTTALEVPFVAPRGESFLFASWAAAAAAVDPAHPDSLLLSRGRPRVIALGRRRPDGAAVYDLAACRGGGSPEPAGCVVAPGDPPRGFVEVPAGVAPAAFSALTLKLQTHGRACEATVVLGDDPPLYRQRIRLPEARVCQLSLPLRTQASWCLSEAVSRDARLPFRLEDLGAGAVQLLGLALHDPGPRVELGIDGGRSRVSRGGPPPSFQVVDHTGSPVLRLRWRALFLQGPDLVYVHHTAPGCAPADRGVAPARRYEPAPDNPPPFLDVLTRARFDEIRSATGLVALPFEVFAEVALTAAGPALGRSAPVAVTIEPQEPAR